MRFAAHLQSAIVTPAIAVQELQMLWNNVAC